VHIECLNGKAFASIYVHGGTEEWKSEFRQQASRDE
jgi:hypothetical protein